MGDDTYRQELSDRLRKRLEGRNLARVASLAGINKNTLWRFYKGQRKTGVAILEKLATYLDGYAGDERALVGVADAIRDARGEDAGRVVDILPDALISQAKDQSPTQVSAYKEGTEQ